MGGHLIHRDAGRIDAKWLGLTVTVLDRQGRTVTGGLSDFHHAPKGWTFLFIGGHPCISVRSTATVTLDTLHGLPGGGQRG